MPSDTSVDLKAVEKKAGSYISSFGGKFARSEIQPVAFGLNALVIYLIMDEKIGSTERLEHSISSMQGVNSVEVTDVRRSIG